MFGVALSNLLSVGLHHTPVSLFIVDEVSFFSPRSHGVKRKYAEGCMFLR